LILPTFSARSAPSPQLSELSICGAFFLCAPNDALDPEPRNGGTTPVLLRPAIPNYMLKRAVLTVDAPQTWVRPLETLSRRFAETDSSLRWVAPYTVKNQLFLPAVLKSFLSFFCTFPKCSIPTAGILDPRTGLRLSSFSDRPVSERDRLYFSRTAVFLPLSSSFP